MGLHQARFFSIGSRLGNVAVLEEVESVIQDPLLHNQTIPENIPSENILLEEVTQFGDEATMESVESAIEEVLRVEEIAPEVSAPIEVSTTPSETIEDGQTITEAAGMNLEATLDKLRRLSKEGRQDFSTSDRREESDDSGP